MAQAVAANAEILASADLTEGFGYLTFPVGAANSIMVRSVGLGSPEPATEQRLFGQPLFDNWG